jgi:two-component system, OmpR family, phosphate regulon sensor histidine kinase PhoR
MRLATRFFLATSLLVAATVVGLILAADSILRRGLESETAAALEREARLIAREIPADSLAWPETAIRLGELIGHRVTLIDAKGRVRGDTEFPSDALPELENHGGRPEVLEAEDSGVGLAARHSVSTNQDRMYVAIRGGPPGIAVIRLSATLAAVNAQVSAVQEAVALAGGVGILIAALLAWVGGRHYAGPLVSLTTAARAIAAERQPAFPNSRIPEIAQHIRALSTMHGELTARFQEVREQREQSAALVEAMVDGVIAADARGVIHTCNSAARRLLRVDPTATLPALPELFHEKNARELVRAVRDGQAIEQRELRLDDRELAVAGRPLPDGGALLVLRDISRLRRLETVRRDFVANVSHELKTPLTAIAGYAETLVGEAPPESSMAKFAATILAHARRMQRLVEDLLDLSRIESGGWRPTPAPVDLAAAAREAWAPFVERAQRQNIDFVVTVSPGADRVFVDPDALRQIFTNLFDNALRHLAQGGQLTVTAEVATGGNGVQLAVSDTGTGIPPEHVPRIFERFYRVDPGRSREQGGTGLGLAIVKHLVDAHEGQVAADSVPGQGTTIRLHLPAATVVTDS